MEERCSRKCHISCGCWWRADLCQLSADVGRCDDYEIAFYYNSSVDRCEQFWWGGCDGNANRFSTVADCERRCRQKNVIRRPPTEQHDGKTQQRPIIGVYCLTFHINAFCLLPLDKLAYLFTSLLQRHVFKCDAIANMTLKLFCTFISILFACYIYLFVYLCLLLWRMMSIDFTRYL